MLVVAPPSNNVATSVLSNKNRAINPGMPVDQRNNGAAQTIVAGAALAYTVDRWYAYSTGANVTGQRVANAGLYQYQFTGASGVTGIGFGQRIETANSADLAGGTAILSVNLANSLLTTVTWTAYYASSTDAFGTLASPTKTQIATGTFTVSSTLTRYTAAIAVPAASTTGIEIVFSVGAQTSGVWTIGAVQLEAGAQATPFERRQIGQELALCQRYFQIYQGYGTLGFAYNSSLIFMMGAVPVVMRTAPTITLLKTTFNYPSGTPSGYDMATTGNYVGGSGITFSGGLSGTSLEIGLSGFSGLNAGAPYYLNFSGPLLTLSSEL